LPVMIQLASGCDVGEYYDVEPIFIKNFGDSNIVVTMKTRQDIVSLKNDDCVIKSGRPDELRELIEELRPQLREERDEKLRELRLNRSVKKKDVLDKDDLEDFLKNKHPDTPQDAPDGGVMSPYQLYVTPDDVEYYLDDNSLSTKEEIYEAALQWVWVSEQTLNNEDELWLYPVDFLDDTPSYLGNPVKGRIASDCSEQANTLASLLIASDEYDETEVRVVLGLVDFGGSTGGHAWVEVYEDARWFALEPTAGYYYDDDNNKFVKTDVSVIPYEYFSFYEFPAEEIWYYYNHEYFYDFVDRRGNAPQNWRKMAKSYFQSQITASRAN